MAGEKLNANRLSNDGYNPTDVARERVDKHDSKVANNTPANNTPDTERVDKNRQDNVDAGEVDYQESEPLVDAALLREVWQQFYTKTQFKTVLFIILLLFLLISLFMVLSPNKFTGLFHSKTDNFNDHIETKPSIQTPKKPPIVILNTDNAVSLEANTTRSSPSKAPIPEIHSTQVIDLDFASGALLTAKDHINRVTGKILVHYPRYLSLSQQILSLRQIYTGIFTKINRGATPNPLVYKSFVQRLEQAANRCQNLNQKQADWVDVQDKNLLGLQQALEDYRGKIQQLNNYDPELQLAYPQNDNGQLQYILATNISEQINILSEFDSLAKQLQQQFKSYIKIEAMLLNLMGDYSIVLRLSVDTLSIQYKATVINEATETVYQLYGYLEQIAQQQKQIRQQQQQLKHRFLAQYE